MFSAHGDPGHEIADAVCGVIIGELGQCLGEPCVRVDAAELAVLDERGDDGPVVAALVGAGEQSVFPVQRQRPDRSLDGIVVEVNSGDVA